MGFWSALSGGRLVFAKIEQREILDYHKALSEAVVQLGGNALALVLLRSDQLAGESMLQGLHLPKPGYAIAPRRGDDPRRRQRCQNLEDPGLIERRQNLDRQVAALRTPHAIAVARRDLEPVPAGRDVGVVGGPPAAGVVQPGSSSSSR